MFLFIIKPDGININKNINLKYFKYLEIKNFGLKITNLKLQHYIIKNSKNWETIWKRQKIKFFS